VPEEVRTLYELDLGEGVLVGSVEADAPAGRSGLRRGDVILRWNEHQATDPTLLSRAIAATKIGSTAKLVILRHNGDGTEQLALDVEVERRPAQ
jgi:serine protease Do